MTEIFWAKLPGFSPWPARKCSIYEENMLRELQPPKVSDTVPVVFLGLKKERCVFSLSLSCGWPFDPQLCRSAALLSFYFTAEHGLSKRTFSLWMRKLGVVKSTRRNSKRIEITGLPFLRVQESKSSTSVSFNWIMMARFVDTRCRHDLQSRHVCCFSFLQEIPVPVELCDVCHGSEHSGSTISCGICLAKGVHWHCFLPDDPDALNKIWICDECCVVSWFAFSVGLFGRPQTRPCFTGQSFPHRYHTDCWKFSCRCTVDCQWEFNRSQSWSGIETVEREIGQWKLQSSKIERQ